MFQLRQKEKAEVVAICDTSRSSNSRRSYLMHFPNTGDHGCQCSQYKSAIQVSVFVVRAFVKLRKCCQRIKSWLTNLPRWRESSKIMMNQYDPGGCYHATDGNPRAKRRQLGSLLRKLKFRTLQKRREGLGVLPSTLRLTIYALRK